jgi:hypothetical protein
MARFIGTVDDYEKYIGPRIRNIVNTLTKGERDKRQGICEFCKEKSELQSAHRHGKERKTLIFEALKKYNNGSYIDVDIEKCENEILELHNPINEVFYFLCMECHRKYDNNNKIFPIKTEIENKKEHKTIIVKLQPKRDVSTINDDIQHEIKRIQNRIPKWFNNKDQINSKILYAYIKLLKKNGSVSFEELKDEVNIDTFYTNYTQMKNFGSHNHGKIFEEKDGKIIFWNEVENIIWGYYNNSVK